MGKPRCRWCAAAPDFVHYHDTEWELRGHLTYFPDPQFQLLPPFGRLATRGPPLQAATGELLQLGDERVGAERPAGAFRVAQGREQGQVGRHAEKLGEASDALDQRRHAHQAVIASREMRAGARPGRIVSFDAFSAANRLPLRRKTLCTCARATSFARTGLSAT